MIGKKSFGKSTNKARVSKMALICQKGNRGVRFMFNLFDEAPEGGVGGKKKGAPLRRPLRNSSVTQTLSSSPVRTEDSKRTKKREGKVVKGRRGKKKKHTPQAAS